MKVYGIALLFFALLFISCRKEIKYENIGLKNGLYTDLSNGKILDGKYKSLTQPENALQKENVIEREFSDGIPTGEWTETYGGDLYFNGEYLIEEDLKSDIQKTTKCKRVDLDFWKELYYPYLTIGLIQPEVTDTLTLQKVIELSKSQLLNKYNFRSVRIDSIGQTRNNYIYSSDLK